MLSSDAMVPRRHWRSFVDTARFRSRWSFPERPSDTLRALATWRGKRASRVAGGAGGLQLSLLAQNNDRIFSVARGSTRRKGPFQGLLVRMQGCGAVLPHHMVAEIDESKTDQFRDVQH